MVGAAALGMAMTSPPRWALLFFLLAGVVMAQSPPNGGVAEFEEGHRLTDMDQIEEALAYFRSACRSQPFNPVYLNDLGVAEMRLGQFQSARNRLRKALSIDPSYQTAGDNLAQLEQFVIGEKGETMEAWDPSPHQLHRLRPVPRLSIQDLNKPWAQQYRDLNQPFILTGAMDQGWDKARLTLDALTRQFPMTTVDFYPHNLKDSTAQPLATNLTYGVSHLYQPSGVYHGVDASEAGTYLQWSLDYHQEWKAISQSMSLPPIFVDMEQWLDSCFPDDGIKTAFFHKTYWVTVVMGEDGSGTYNHPNPLETSSYQVQLEGVTRWHLCSPQQSPFMYGLGEIDAFRPNYKLYPLLRKASCLQEEVKPGEILFYPDGWWHQTRNMATPTMAITGNIVTKTNHAKVAARLHELCADGLGLGDDGVCQGIERCEKIWQDTLSQIQPSPAGGRRGDTPATETEPIKPAQIPLGALGGMDGLRATARAKLPTIVEEEKDKEERITVSDSDPSDEATAPDKKEMKENDWDAIAVNPELEEGEEEEEQDDDDDEVPPALTAPDGDSNDGVEPTDSEEEEKDSMDEEEEHDASPIDLALEEELSSPQPPVPEVAPLPPIDDAREGLEDVEEEGELLSDLTPSDGDSAEEVGPTELEEEKEMGVEEEGHDATLVVQGLEQGGEEEQLSSPQAPIPDVGPSPPADDAEVNLDDDHDMFLEESEQEEKEADDLMSEGDDEEESGGGTTSPFPWQIDEGDDPMLQRHVWSADDGDDSQEDKDDEASEEEGEEEQWDDERYGNDTRSMEDQEMDTSRRKEDQDTITDGPGSEEWFTFLGGR